MRTLIASNNTLIRNGIHHVLQQTGQTIAILSPESTNKLTAIVQREKPELLFFDKNNETALNHQAMKDLKQKFPDLKIIVLSELEYAAEIQESLEIGIEGFLTHECDKEEIQKSLQSIARNEKFYCQRILSLLLEIRKPVNNYTPIQLTERETEITRYIAQGNTNKQIAEILCISPHTVHTHRKSLMKKLGVSSATEVTLFAFHEGLID